MPKLKVEELPKGILQNRANQVREKSPDFLSVYANGIAVSITPWDMVLNFGRNIERDGQNIVQERAEIIMSKELAKVLVSLMQTHFDIYEKQFGEITIPDLNKIQAEHKELKGK